jgi:putative ATP-dependent endonuclease of the OLD family
MEIPWSVRTDNDIIKVPKITPQKWNFAGLNRALNICKQSTIDYIDHYPSEKEINDQWIEVSKKANLQGVFISMIDLENDLGQACEAEIKKYTDANDLVDAVKYMQARKAIRMGEFLKDFNASLKNLNTHDLAKPLLYCAEKARERIGSLRKRRRKV